MLSALIVGAVGFLGAFALVDALTGREPDPTAAATESTERAAPNRPIVDTDGTTAAAPVETLAPIDPDAERLRAPCSVREFRLVFDRESGVAALYSDDGRRLASVTPGSHRFDARRCPARPASRKAYSAGDRPATYETGALACTASQPIDVEIHPTVGPDGQQTGNVLLVSERSRPALIASVVVVDALEGRRVYYSARHCTHL